MIMILAAVGWMLAAFLCGFMAGERRQKPMEAPSAKSTAASSVLDPEQQEAAKRARREWQNFLNYDGTVQSSD